MPIINEKLWQEWQDKNKGSEYSKRCVDVAREVMKMLDSEEYNEPLHKGYNPDKQTAHYLICKADDKIEAGGITGFMAGAVASMVHQCHSRGKEFKESYN